MVTVYCSNSFEFVVVSCHPSTVNSIKSQFKTLQLIITNLQHITNANANAYTYTNTPTQKVTNQISLRYFLDEQIFLKQKEYNFNFPASFTIFFLFMQKPILFSRFPIYELHTQKWK